VKPDLDLTGLVRLLGASRRLILRMAGMGLLGGFVLTLFTPPAYRSWVTMKVEQPDVVPAAAPRADGIATQVGLLSSRSLAEEVASKLNIEVDSVAASLEVETPTDSRLIRFSVDAESPQLSAAIANRFADSFIAADVKRRYDASVHSRRFLERRIADTRAKLERSELQLVSYAREQGIVAGSGEEESPQGQSLAALNKALAEATARRMVAEGAYLAGTTSEAASATRPLRQARATLEAEYREKRTLLRPGHPDMLALRSRIDELERQVAIESGVTTSALHSDYLGALATERSMELRVDELASSVLDLKGRGIRYRILLREVESNRTLHDALLQAFRQLGISGAAETAPVSIVDRAEVPDRPYRPDPLFNLLSGLGIGLLAGAGAAIAFDQLRDPIRTAEDVRARLGIAFIGGIPTASAQSSLIEELKDPGSAISEACSAILASLRRDGVPKSLMVTSARASEGKSATALAIAQAFARLGSPVLLVDANFHDPAFRLESSDRVGLSRLLADGRESLPTHIVATRFPNLYLLPAGPLPGNPADLLSTARADEIFREASTSFDLVIVDAPPVLGRADSLLLGTVAGQALFVVESGQTPVGAATEALGLLGSVNVLGAVLNRASNDLDVARQKRRAFGSLDRNRSGALAGGLSG
jgi:capsular exopolysaccharide synthesis family protein